MEALKMAAEATGMALLGIVMVAVVTRLTRLLRPPPPRCGLGWISKWQAEQWERERHRLLHGSADVRRLVRVAADVEPAHHDRLAALSVRHGVSLGAVVAAAIQVGLPAVERRSTPLIILGEIWRQGEWRVSTAPPPGVEIEGPGKLWETPPSRRAAADTGTLIREVLEALAERGAADAEAAPVRRRLVRVAADVEPALHDRLAVLQARVAADVRQARVVADVESARHTLFVAVLQDRHGVSLDAVVAAAIQVGLPAVERWPAPSGPGGRTLTADERAELLAGD